MTEPHPEDNFDAVADFTTVPAGTYVCKVAEVRPGITRAGDERWSLRLEVVEGPHTGKQAAWDSLVFTPRGLARARTILRALGFTKTKEHIESQDLVGKTCLVQVQPVESLNWTGERVRRNEVPYGGYSALPG